MENLQSEEEVVKEPTKRGGVKGKYVNPIDEDVMPDNLTDIERTKRLLDREPKISMNIPLGIGEKPGAFETVTINGYRYVIKKGAMVDLPKSVASVLADHYSIQMDNHGTGAEFLADRTGVEDALN